MFPPTDTPMVLEIPSPLEVVPSSYLPSLPLSVISGDTSEQGVREEIVRELATAWLDYFTREDLPNRVRLEEYRIRSVAILDQERGCPPGIHKEEFRAEIIFDAKISDVLYNPWLAGGGSLSEDHLWIIGKGVYPLVFRDRDIYTWSWDWSCTTPAP